MNDPIEDTGPGSYGYADRERALVEEVNRLNEEVDRYVETKGDPGFDPPKPRTSAEKCGPAVGNCPVCGACHVPMSSVAGVDCCSDCYAADWVRIGIIAAARDARSRARGGVRP